MRKLYTTLLLALCCTSLSAQTVSTPKYSGHLIRLFDGAYYPRPSCDGGTIFYEYWGPKGIMMGMFTEDGRAMERPWTLNRPMDGYDHNLLFAVGNKPYFIFSGWDKKTGIVDLFIQQYSEQLEPEGDATVLGRLSFDPSSYRGARLHIDHLRSPDGSKHLFLFDRIQSGGIKLAMCWVFDSNMNKLWEHTYQIPTQAQGSRRSAWIMNDGAVYMQLNAVALEEGDLKEKKDGTVAIKSVKKDKHRSYSWFKLHGNEFRQWSPYLKDDTYIPVFPEQFGETVVFAGLVDHPSNDLRKNWIILDPGDDFVPQEIHRGAIPSNSDLDPDGVDAWDVVSDPDGRPIFYLRSKTQATIMKLDTNGDVLWETNTPWTGNTAAPFGDGLMSLGNMKPGDVKKLPTGEPIKPVPLTNYHGAVAPSMLLVDGNGVATRTSLLPEQDRKNVNHGYQYYPELLGSCGCFARYSHRTKQGLQRVDMRP